MIPNKRSQSVFYCQRASHTNKYGGMLRSNYTTQHGRQILPTFEMNGDISRILAALENLENINKDNLR